MDKTTLLESNKILKEKLKNVASLIADTLPFSNLSLIVVFLVTALFSASQYMPELKVQIESLWVIWEKHVLIACVISGLYGGFIIVFRKNYRLHSEVCRIVRSDSSTLGVASIPKQYSQESQWVAAVHEAGHVFMLTTLDKDTLPSSFDVRIKVSRDSSNAGYFYRYWEEDEEVIKEREIHHWKMLCDRAGAIAESIILKSDHCGSSTDYSSWERRARSWLIQHQDYPFFSDAQSKHEAELNYQSMLRLAEEQDEQLEVLFSSNEMKLKGLAQAIFDNKSLNKEEIIKILNLGIKHER